MTLDKHFTPVWEIIENFRHYLALKHKKPILEKELAKEDKRIELIKGLR